MILDSSHSGRQDWRRERLGPSVRGPRLNGQPLPSAPPQPTSDYRTSAPGAPGPFAPADGGRLRRIVATGGFCDITLEPVPGRIESATTWRMWSRSSPHLTSPGPCLPASLRTRSPRPSTPSVSSHASCRSGRRRDGREGLARAGPQPIRDRGNPATLKADGGASIGSASSRVRRTPGC
jgi:hypothetical protein